MNRLQKIQKIKKLLNENNHSDISLNQAPQINIQVIDTGFPIRESEGEENE